MTPRSVLQVMASQPVAGGPAVDDVVVVEGLGKAFGATVAVRDVHFTVGRGQVLGLLGPNGAGKTTTVRMLATLCAPDRGRATVDGLDVVRDAAAVRRVISLAGQHAAVDPQLTGRENLRLVARLHHLDRDSASARAGELLGAFGLSAAADRPAKTYSGGMRRRLDLAASVVNRPSVLFLDEPTTGLDPTSRVAMWTAVRDLVAGGTTVVLTTQYLEEADQLCDRLVVVDRGTVVAAGTPHELKSAVGGDVVEIALDGPLAARHAAALAERATGAPATVDPATSRVVLPVGSGSAQALGAVVRALGDAGVAPAEIGVRRPSLDEVFVALTGHRAEEGHTDPGRPGLPVPPVATRSAGSGHHDVTASALHDAGLGCPARPRPSGRERRPLRQGLDDWGQVAWRNALHVVRQPVNLIFLVVQPVMFVVMFRYVFGGALALAVPHGQYVEFLLPGIVAQTLSFGSMSTAVGLSEDLGTGMVDRLRSLPVARSAVLAGRLVTDTAQYLLVMATMLAVGVAVGFRFEEGLAAGIAMGALALGFGLVASTYAALVGVLTRDPQASMTVGLTTLFPVCFISGAFVPIATLPGWLQPVARANPVTVVVEAMRALAYGGPAGSRTIQAAAWMVALAAAFLPLAVRAYHRAT